MSVMNEMNELIPIEAVNAVEVFESEKTIQALVDAVRAAATDFEPDVSTPEGRKEIASQAYKVSQSKGVIDKAGKAMTDEWYNKKKVVDAGRRLARDELDALRDEIRQPLTAWEEAEKLIAKEIALKAEMEADEIEAHERNDLIDRETKVREAEERMEADRVERERIEREEREEEERKAQEERLKAEAEENARQDAADELERERLAREETDRQRIAAEERAKQDAIDAEEKAEREKQEAIEREQRLAREEADRVERERIRREEDEKREAQARAANRENRRKVNRAAVDALIKGGVSKTGAQDAVTLIASGKVPSISIRY